MPTKVFVGNIQENCSQESIEDLFAPYGKINEVSVLGKYAFVHFEKKEDADKAVKDLNQTMMFGKVIIVEISKKQGPRPTTGGNSGKRPDGPQNRRGPPPPVPVGGILGLGPSPANSLAPLNLLSQMNTLASLGAQPRNNDLLDGHTRNDIRQRDPSPRNFNRPPRRGSPQERPDPEVRVRREVVHTQDIPERFRVGLSDGYVIHERYYVDPSHSLLKGLRLSDLPRIGDPYLSREAPRADREYVSSYREFERRSPPPAYRGVGGRTPPPGYRESSERSAAAFHDMDGRDRSPLSFRENALRERDYLSRDYGRIDPYSRR